MNAYILIGGRSRRMRSSKTSLFLDRIVEAARPVFDDVIAVQRANGDAASIRTIFEGDHEDEGAIFGVVRALQDARGDAFLLAVDYPLITSDVLRYLRERRGIPLWNGRAQTLCAVWPGDALDELEQRIAEHRYDLRGIRDREMIPESDLRARFPGEPLANVNTPEELERLYGQGLLAPR